MVTHRLVLLLLVSGSAAAPVSAEAQAGPPPVAGRAMVPARYDPSSACAGCHPRTAEQHGASHHETSFRNPLFQAQYFEELLPRASRDPSLVEEARTCTACHAPVAFAYRKAHLSAPAPAEPSMSGVTCDLCHTISGIDGPEPRNGNFISKPSAIKLGPLPSETGWHRAYSELQTRSELCGTCHEAVNRHGVVVKATYTEWKKSPSAKAGVQCQDCHMTRDGFQVNAQSRFEDGAAASGSLLNPPKRDKLHTHRFPGAHSQSQVEGAVGLAFKEVPKRVGRDQPFTFSLVVDNHRTGHKMPTGSADLRLLWLEVTARAGGRTWSIPMRTKARGGYGVAGAGEEDATLLGGTVPDGARTYRAVFFDGEHRQTLSSYEARQIAWDNRLEAGEQRVEPYEAQVPVGVAGALFLEARLMYLSYPAALAKRFEVAPAQPVEVAKATAEVAISAEAPPPAVLKGGPR